MRIRIDEIPRKGLSVEFTDDEELLAQALAATSLPPGVQIDPRLTGRFTIARRKGELFFEAAIDAAMRLQCSRCLTEFRQPERVDIDLVVRQRTSPEQDMNAEFVDSEAEAFFIDGDVIDPGEIILQELLLNVPMKPLCKEDCPGLCPTCGRPKGSPQCTCSEERRVDPRWAALERLKEKITP
ncbi:MAG: DUF177 domain-containing protein [Desulfomonile sp.]|nr:DUF177 domain-containing protein [Desulfomonile sp.]